MRAPHVPDRDELGRPVVGIPGLPGEERRLGDRVGGRGDGCDRHQERADPGSLDEASGRFVAPKEEEDREDADQREHAVPKGPVAWRERRGPGHRDDEAERRSHRPARHHEHRDDGREAEDREQDDGVHRRKVEAIEGKLGLVEVEEAAPDAVQDGAEEIPRGIARSCVRERDVRGAACGHDGRPREDERDDETGAPERDRSHRR